MMSPKYKKTEIGMIPEDWEISTLEKEYELYAGGDLDKSDYSDVKTPLFRYHILSNGLLNNGVYGFCSHPKYQGNAITITGRGDIGHCTYREDAFSAIIRLLVCQPRKQINSKYVAEYLDYSKPFVFESTGVPQLTVPQIKNTIIPLPPFDEQNRIAEALSDIDELISSLEKLIAKKKAIKQGAMKQIFSNNWSKQSLGSLCSLVTKQTGFDYSAYIKPALVKRKAANTIPMIQTINFREKRFSLNTDYYIPISVASQFPNIMLTEKCVLFSIVGASVGNIGLFPGGLAFCGGAIGITRFIDLNDADWVYYYMNSKEGQAQINYVTKGGAQATVTIADIRNFSIPMPSQDEKEKIINVLSAIDNEIDYLERNLEKTRRIRQGMTQQLLTGKTRLR